MGCSESKDSAAKPAKKSEGGKATGAAPAAETREVPPAAAQQQSAEPAAVVAERPAAANPPKAVAVESPVAAGADEAEYPASTYARPEPAAGFPYTTYATPPRDAGAYPASTYRAASEEPQGNGYPAIYARPHRHPPRRPPPRPMAQPLFRHDILKLHGLLSDPRAASTAARSLATRIDVYATKVALCNTRLRQIKGEWEQAAGRRERRVLTEQFHAVKNSAFIAQEIKLRAIQEYVAAEGPLGAMLDMFCDKIPRDAASPIRNTDARLDVFFDAVESVDDDSRRVLLRLHAMRDESAMFGGWAALQERHEVRPAHVTLGPVY